MKKIGKKTQEWNKAKRELKRAFESAGITACELHVSPACSQFFLTWAHGDKRRYLTKKELYTLVALGCVNCHNVIEKWPREKMREFIELIIKSRRVQPAIKVPNEI